MLTAAQRYFYDVNGYVAVAGVFNRKECRELIALAERMDADPECAYKHDGYPKTRTLTVLSRCAWYDPRLLATALHPGFFPIIEDVVGGEVRLEEHQFLINCADAETGAPRPCHVVSVDASATHLPRAEGAPLPDGQQTGMLTAAQRYFYDVNGYVAVAGVFNRKECRELIALAERMDADPECAYKHDGYPKTRTLTVLSRCAWYDPRLLATALHPGFFPIIEDVVGGEVRLEEHQFLINCADAETGAPRPVRDEAWHRGIAPSFGSFDAGGHYHCLFTKAFIYLTDNPPGQGTWVVPGSHRMETPAATVREFLDDTLARQLETRAGDVLILSETLIHAGPRLAGGPPRYSLVYGYTPPFMQTWPRYDPPAELLERVSPRERALLAGESRYAFRRGQF